MIFGFILLISVKILEQILKDKKRNRYNKKIKGKTFKENNYFNREINNYEKNKKDIVNSDKNQNEILDKIIQKTEKPRYDYKKAKGETYEKYIAKFWKNEGYKVYMNGLNNGNADGGIDVICHKDKETILIQCKHWKNPVNQKEIRQFIGDCYVYINKRKQYLKNRTIRKMFITSCEETKIAVELYVKENSEEIEYISIPYI